MYSVNSRRFTLAVAAMLAIATPALAQSRRNDRNGRDNVPPGQLPPAGMCRVWIDGVPPGHQPAPTSCATAVATRPANGRVIYGDRNNSFPGKGKGKWKNAERSSGDVDVRRNYPYGSIFSSTQRRAQRRERDDEDNRRAIRGDRDDDDRFDDRSYRNGSDKKDKHKYKGKHKND